jgi:hypothetical protein
MNMSHVVAVISLLIKEPLLQGCTLTIALPLKRLDLKSRSPLNHYYYFIAKTQLRALLLIGSMIIVASWLSLYSIITLLDPLGPTS